MGTEISAAGYRDLANHAKSTIGWDWIEIGDTLGAAIHRYRISASTAASWTTANSTIGAKPKITLTLKGDSTVLSPLPTTIKHSKVFAGATVGTAMNSIEITPFTFGSTADELTIEHTISFPSTS